MAKIILHGDCLVSRASELHQVFLHHLNGPDDQLEVDMSSVGRCDLSFFQLMCSAARGFYRKNKRLRLLSSMPAAMVTQLEKTGWATACQACHQAGCFMTAAVQKNETGIIKESKGSKKSKKSKVSG